MTYQVKNPVSKFAFQTQPAALQRGAGRDARDLNRRGASSALPTHGGALHVELI
jgi:hypothetical protein